MAGRCGRCLPLRVRLAAPRCQRAALLFGLPLFYPIVYTLIYNPEVVRDIPIAVVDLSHTAESRSLTRHLDATSAIAVNYRCANMAEARDLMARGEIYGILEIPRDYARDIGRGTTAHADFYSDMSLLLRYRTFVELSRTCNWKPAPKSRQTNSVPQVSPHRGCR